MQVLAEKSPPKTTFLPCKNGQNTMITRNSGTVFKFCCLGARYLDPRTSRWISADPAVSDYIPQAPTDDDARKRNQNLPGMGGVYNVVNLHVYHYAGNNPVKYTDPDGKQPTTPSVLEQPAYEGIIARQKQAEALADAVEGGIGGDSFGKFIDKIFLGGKYEKAAKAFALKVLHGFIEAQMSAYSKIQPDENGHFSENSLIQYTDMINNEMIFNYSEQKELGPYEGDVKLPRMTAEQANFELNVIPFILNSRKLEIVEEP